MSDRLKLNFRETCREISNALGKSKKGDLELPEYLKMVATFEELGGQLYQIRKSLAANDPFRAQAEDWVAKFSQEILTLQREDPSVNKAGKQQLRQYRMIWRKYFSLFAFTVSFFIASFIVGWTLVIQKPDMASVFLSQDLMEMILDKKAWFQDIGNPLFTGLKIAFHNMQVSFYCFLFAGFLGFGGLVYLALNGLFFGAIMAYCSLHGFDDALGSFVVAHGVLELTLIVCSTFAGLIFGRVFFLRPRVLFKVRFRVAFADSLVVIAGILPWFLVCGLVESSLSPQTDVPYFFRWVVGFIIAIAFWIFTFWPLGVSSKLKRG